MAEQPPVDGSVLESGERVTGRALSPDGRVSIAVSQYGVRLQDAATGARLDEVGFWSNRANANEPTGQDYQVLLDSPNELPVAFSRDGRTVFVGTHTGPVLEFGVR